MAAKTDLDEGTISCVDAWVEKLLNAQTLTEAEVVQLCEKVSCWRCVYGIPMAASIPETLVNCIQVPQFAVLLAPHAAK
jgi:hypothetical protein